MDAVEDVKSRLSIEDVIGDYLELKRAGRNLRALSPFGNEKTPSFMVSPEKQIWHDFSSGKGGNMFSFIMEMEGVDFKGALEILARKAGVDLSQYQRGDSGRAKQKEQLYKLLDAATHFYQKQFTGNKDALNYILNKRKFNKQTVLDFKIGYAPNTGRALVDYLKKKGYSEEQIKLAGLATKRYQLASDMFRGRIMIPLSDSVGRVVGFTARLLNDDPKQPKYINTPQTLLYDKGRQVYGFHLAKDAIRKSDFAVIVEGNLDVIASHQAGVKNVVATAGTAMTPMHLKELGRFTHDIRLAFDQDGAGLKAAERAIPLANQAGVSLNIITIPEGKDPDELIQRDPAAWEAAIGTSQYALDWFMDRMKIAYDISTAEGKRKFSDQVLPVIRQLTDTVEQDHYLGVVADELGVTKAALTQKFETTTKVAKPPRRRQIEVAKVDKATAEQVKAQNQFMALLLTYPDLRAYAQHVTPIMLHDDSARDFLVLIKKQPHITSADILKLPDNREYAKILEVIYEELYRNLEYVELQYEAARLQVRLIETYVKSQKAALAEQLTTASSEHTTELLTKVKELDNLLMQAKKETAHGK